MKSKGFTLIEMLVSMTLLSLLLLLSTTAYSFFSQKWNGRLGHYNQTLSDAKNLVIMQNVVKSVVPYVVLDNETNPVLYFEGNRNGFVAVANSSIYQPHLPAVVRLQVTQNADFTYVLSYQEAVMDKRLLVELKQPLSFTQPLVLLENIQDIQFEYFAYPSRDDKYWTTENSTGERGTPVWFESLDSVTRGVHPEQIKISILHKDRTIVLPIVMFDTRQRVLAQYDEEV